jgi:hypothetical protein
LAVAHLVTASLFESPHALHFHVGPNIVTNAGTCQQLFELCSDPDVLGCLFILAGSQLGLTAEKLEVAVWRTGLQDHVLLSLDNPQVIEFLRCAVHNTLMPATGAQLSHRMI